MSHLDFNFDPNLIDCVFVSMQQGPDIKTYFNMEKEIVEQESMGYLFNLMAKDFQNEKNRLANIILMGQFGKDVKKEIHRLIPHLFLTEFLNTFIQNSMSHPKLIEFVEYYLKQIHDDELFRLKYFGNIFDEDGNIIGQESPRDINYLPFHVSANERFLEIFKEWNKSNDLYKVAFDQIYLKTKTDIVSNFLFDVHNQ
jgi:hypothetical protein